MTGVGNDGCVDETDTVADVVGGGVGEAGSCRCLCARDAVDAGSQGPGQDARRFDDVRIIISFRLAVLFVLGAAPLQPREPVLLANGHNDCRAADGHETWTVHPNAPKKPTAAH